MSIESEYKNLVLTSNPLVYLPLSDSSGSSTIQNLGSSTSTVSIEGTFNSGTSLFGTTANTSYYPVSSTPSFLYMNSIAPMATGFTIEFFIQSDSNIDGGIMSAYPSGNAGGFFIWRDYEGKLQFGTLNSGSYNYLSSNSIILDTTVKHCVFVWTGTERKIYINGILDASDSGGYGYNSASAATFSTTAFADVFGSHLNNAKLSHLAIYNNALNSSTILSHYNASIGSEPPVVINGWIFDAVITEPGYSPSVLFDGYTSYIGQTLIIHQDDSITLDRVSFEEDIKNAKFVIYSGRKYEVAPNVYANSMLLPTWVKDLIAASEYSIYLKEVTIGE